MSGIRFASDTENPGPVGSRAKPRKRRSSILKSPSRNALHDLDPNSGEERETTSHAKKKKRLSSRRVSFANTYQVQEFLTAQQLNILEDTKADREDAEAFSPEKIDQQAPEHSTSSSVNTVQHANISQSLQPDTSVGPGHCIRGQGLNSEGKSTRPQSLWVKVFTEPKCFLEDQIPGLEILLSGPIKKQSVTESFPKMLHCPEGSIAGSPQGGMYPSDGTAPLPMIDEACEVAVERQEPQANTNERSDLKEEPQGWPGLAVNPDNVSVGLIGPTYHCRLPVTDSLSSSCHGSLSALSADHSIFEDQTFDLDHTSNFESTRGRDHFLSAFADSWDAKPTREPVFAKKDASAFLRSFMGSGNTQASGSPPRKKDAKTFLNSLFGNEGKQSYIETNQSETTTSGKDEHTSIFDQNAVASEMELTTCVSNKEIDGCQKKDTSASLKSLMLTDSRVSFDYVGHSSFPSDNNQKTCVFGQNEATGAMEFTTCISGVIKEASAILHVPNQPDATVRFGEDYAANMELTQCIGDLQKKPNCSGQKPSGRVGRPLEDITRIFDGQMGGGEMDLTTCGVIADSSNRSEAKHGQSTILNYRDTARDLTSCLEGQPLPLSMHKNDATRTFQHDETAAGMEMTMCLEGQPFSLKSQDNMSSNDSGKTLEKTRIFHRDETTAAMEMTSCLEVRPFTLKSQENLPSMLVDSSKDLQQDVNAFNFPQSNVDETRLFSPNDTSCGMDMTECLDERPPSSLLGAGVKNQEISRNEDILSPVDEKTEAFCGIPFTGSPLDVPSEFDKTQVFKPEDTAGMDFTACVGGLHLKTDPAKETRHEEQSIIARKTISPRKLNDEGARHALTLGSEKVQDDCTRRFASTDDTARMELTTCVVNKVSYTPAGIEDSRPLVGQGESTQIFAHGETAQMELTSCLGQLKPLPVLASLSSKQSPSKASLDQTSRMEITDCVTGIFPMLSAESSEADHQQDKTRVFSSVDAAGMEMTKCVGGLDFQSIETGVQSESLKEHTRVFTSEDTAKMEMTSCIGGLMSQPSGMYIMEARGRELQSNHSNAPRVALTGTSLEQPVPQDQTRIFLSDNTASMDMTTCLGGVIGKEITQSSNVSSQELLPDKVVLSQASDSLPDQTRLFTHDDTGKMELTTCIGGFNGSCLIQKKLADVSEQSCHESSQNVQPPEPDSTCVFTYDETNKMEMTKCIGGIDYKAVELCTGAHSMEESSSSRDQRSLGREVYNIASQKAKPSGEISVETSEKSFFQEGQTAQVVLDQAHSDQKRVFSSENTAAMKITSSGENIQAGVSVDGIKQETALQSSTSIPGQLLTDSNTLANQVDRPSKRDSDTFTIDPLSGVKASQQTTRRSDTYTLDNSPETSATVANSTAATVSQRDGSSSSTSDTSKRDSSDEKEYRDMIGELIHWGSLDSAEGIEDEQPMWVENTEDFAQLSAKAGLTCITLMEKKDHTVSKTSHAFPTFGNDKVQDVISTTEIRDTDDVRNPDPTKEKKETVTSPDSSLHDETLLVGSCTSEPVSMEDFLSFVTVNVKKGRRSVLPVIPKLAASQSLSDVLQNHFLIQPKKELYEWAINHLSTSIEKMQDEINEQEQRLSKNNPDVVTEVQRASPEHAALLHEHIQSLHRACSKMSKSSFQEWRLKMISKTHQSLQCVEVEMNEILTSISTSSDALDKAVEELNKYEDSLGKALTRLEQVQPPSEDQVREFINSQKMLVNRNAEVEEIKKTTTALESESLRLKAEIERYQKELVDVREEERSINSQVTSQDDLQDALVKLEDLHCLQLWRLRKHSAEELVFTFLEESLVFVIKLGKEIEGSGGRHKEISSLHLDSSLNDDNGVSARLAHNLIRASIDLPLLHSRHPTTATLKLLLQDVSEMVGQADGIADEMYRVGYRHVVTLNGTNVTVEFSNLDAMVKFWVTFGLQPGSYPFGVISTDFKHKIGILMEDDVKGEVCKVTPGFAYFSRLVESIDRMIEKHVPSSPTI